METQKILGVFIVEGGETQAVVAIPIEEKANGV